LYKVIFWRILTILALYFCRSRHNLFSPTSYRST